VAKRREQVGRNQNRAHQEGTVKLGVGVNLKKGKRYQDELLEGNVGKGATRCEGVS